MLHMLSCFNLKSGITIDEFSRAISVFANHLTDLQLIHSRGPIGRRHSDTIMDTDVERDQEYYFIMSFRDRAQCDRAIEHILPHAEPVESIHKDVYSKIEDQVFICWEDLKEE